jgi:glycosyltransferase involved in cell wall biosynthesis
MKKIISYTALLYGKPYLASAIRSIIDAVDEVYILYTDKPSHGSQTHLQCPDTEDELRAIAEQAAGSKLRWHKGHWTQENEQRNSIAEYAPDADVILICDSDEVYRSETLKLLEEEIDYNGTYITIPFYHIYRNFHHAIIHDPAAPPRILFPKSQRRDLVGRASLHHAISHFGYCQPAEYMRYKLSIHGHKHQLRYTADEYTDKVYLDPTRWDDLHPVGSQFWNAEAINPRDYMPDWMLTHEYARLDMVK